MDMQVVQHLRDEIAELRQRVEALEGRVADRPADKGKAKDAKAD